MPVEAGKAGPDDTAEPQECLFIDLISCEQFSVVAEVTQKPAELPERSIRALEASIEGQCLIRSWLDDAKAKREERFLRMPAIGGSFHADQEQALEVADQIGMSRMQTGEMSSHDCTSGGWE